MKVQVQKVAFAIIFVSAVVLVPGFAIGSALYLKYKLKKREIK